MLPLKETFPRLLQRSFSKDQRYRALVGFFALWREGFAAGLIAFKSCKCAGFSKEKLKLEV